MSTLLCFLLILYLFTVFYLVPKREFEKRFPTLKSLCIFLLFSFFILTAGAIFLAPIFRLSGSTQTDVLSKWILAILFLINPASEIIRLTLLPYQSSKGSDIQNLPNAGRLIGILERLIIFSLLYQGQYGAIGFVLTAKSVARYNKIAESPSFAESYLLGTLLSSLLTIATFYLIFLGGLV